MRPCSQSWAMVMPNTRSFVEIGICFALHIWVVVKNVSQETQFLSFLIKIVALVEGSIFLRAPWRLLLVSLPNEL